MSGRGRSGPGYVYVLTNPAWEGMVKIGMTSKSPAYRRQQIVNSSGLIEPGDVFYHAWVPDRGAVERAVHSHLWKHRVVKGREMFRVEPERAAAVIDKFKDIPPLPVFTRRVVLPMPPRSRNLNRLLIGAAIIIIGTLALAIYAS